MAKDFRKATIVSIVPFKIEEKKPTLYPGDYIIPPAEYPNGIETLIVGSALSFVYLDADRGSMRISVPAEQIAESVVNDWQNSILAARGDARPGLFTLVGDWTHDEIRREHKEQLSMVKAGQRLWFEALVKMADDDWSKFKQHKMISNLQRIACKCLEIKREWLSIMPKEEEMCPMCRSRVDSQAIVCGTCRFIIHPERYDAKRFATVG